MSTITMKKMCFIIIAVFIGSSIFSRYDISDTQYVQRVFDEINSSFHCNKKPIHPLLIEKFIPSMMSGRWLPKVQSIDIFNAEDNDEYFGPYEYTKKSSTFSCYRKVADGFAQDEYYKYEWLGRLDGDIHVILTEESGGGTIITRFLHFLKLSLAEAYTPEGKKYPQILLTFVRNYALDCYDNNPCDYPCPYSGCYDQKIELLKRSVKITNSKGAVKTLEFDKNIFK